MKLAEFSQRLGVPYRQVRYVLEQGILPRGVQDNPGRGEHRDLAPAQAFWLGIVLMLKQNGVQAPMAGQIADFARQGVRGLTQNLRWEDTFEPFLGKFATSNEWFVDIGDLTWIRMATTAHPSRSGQLDEFPWTVIANRTEAPHATPVVIIRLDLARLAKLLEG